jgi:hypothetical protein
MFGGSDTDIQHVESSQVQNKLVNVFHPNIGEDAAKEITCVFLNTDYEEECCFVRYATPTFWTSRSRHPSRRRLTETPGKMDKLSQAKGRMSARSKSELIFGRGLPCGKILTLYSRPYLKHISDSET